MARPRSSARVRQSNISLICSAVITSGGQSAIVSPAIARQIRPSSCANTLHLGADALSHVERLAALLVRDQLDAADETDATRLADQRMRSERLQAAQERRRHLAHHADDVDALIDLERLDRDGDGDGMRRNT